MAYKTLTFEERYFCGGAYPHYKEEYDPITYWGRGIFRYEILEEPGTKVGILGCGLGFTVADLRKLGVDAYGLEISKWCDENRYPMAEDFCMVGDATKGSSIINFLLFAKTTRFDLLISEDLLPCFTDEEAAQAAEMWRGYADLVVHRISTTFQLERYRERGIPDATEFEHNWHTRAEWREILGPKDKIHRYKGWEEG